VEWISKITDFFKFTTKQHAIVALTTGAILFLPASILNRLGLAAIPAPYNTLVGIAFILSSVYVLTNSLSWSIAWYRRRVKIGDQIQRLEGKMMNLDIGEQAVLREFLIYGQTAIRLPMSNPIVAGLISDGILCLVSRIGRHSLHGPLFSYRLAKEAIPLMDPELLGFPHGAFDPNPTRTLVLNTRGVRWAVENRPEFAHDVEHVDRGIHRW